MACAHCMQDSYGYKQTLKICCTSCFSREHWLHQHPSLSHYARTACFVENLRASGHSTHCVECEESLLISQKYAKSLYSEPKQIQSKPNQMIYFRYVLILSSHLCLGLASDLFPSGFPIKTLYSLLLSPHTYHILRPFQSSRFYHSDNICRGEEVTMLLNIQCPPAPCNLVHLNQNNLLSPLSQTSSVHISRSS